VQNVWGEGESTKKQFKIFSRKNRKTNFIDRRLPFKSSRKTYKRKKVVTDVERFTHEIINAVTKNTWEKCVRHTENDKDIDYEKVLGIV